MKKTFIIVLIIHVVAFVAFLHIKGIPTENDGVSKSLSIINGK